jgi:hypothetical protein
MPVLASVSCTMMLSRIQAGAQSITCAASRSYGPFDRHYARVIGRNTDSTCWTAFLDFEKPQSARKALAVFGNRRSSHG